MLLIRSLRIGTLVAAVKAATAVFGTVAPASALGTGCAAVLSPERGPLALVAILHLLWL